MKKPRRHPAKEERIRQRIYEAEQEAMREALKDLVVGRDDPPQGESMSKIEKWSATGLLDSVAIENKQFVAETLETAMAQVLAGQAEYADFESKIVELREQGFFRSNKEIT